MSEKLIIIGSGPAGLTAAIYAARANLAPLLFEGFQAGGIPGGQLMITSDIENFPGFKKGIAGPDLMAEIRGQAKRFGTRMITEDIESIDLSKHPFQMTSSSGAAYETCSLIIATGATAKRLSLASEKKFFQHGISACAVCDGGLPIFRNKPLAVIGGGDTAVEDAMYLSKYGSKVYLIHRRDSLRASSIMQQRLLGNQKIQPLWNKIVEEFAGDSLLRSVRLKDTKTGDTSSIEVAGAFEAIGHQPNTGFLNGQLLLNESGYIFTHPGTATTSLDGVFAAGDVQDFRYRQAITAAGSGCMAAFDALKWLTEKGYC
ncbi:MAG TPA: thioredoxin-disulfide reductase [Chitinivibrionales bacterium]|nr:thioredoxin-disulfide reductase [Chitinivibrionales bacterium]